MKRWQFLFPVLLIAALLLSGFTRAAQNQVKISTMQINIWPEYDRPETLVIYRITLSPDTKLPAQISLRIPRAAGSPYTVAMKDLDGLLYDLEYTLIPEGDWNRVVFITSNAELQVEYYDPQIQKQDTLRTINFRWIGDYPIDDLKVIVQQPRTAYDFQLNSTFGSGILNPDDKLVYYTADIGKLDAGIAYNLQFTYEKLTDDLSASTLHIKPVGEFPIQYGFLDSISAVFKPVLENKSLILTGVFVLICLVFFFMVSLLAGRGEKWITYTRKSSRKLPEKAGSEPEEAVYCFQCGKKARPGDVFCRNCGSRLKPG